MSVIDPEWLFAWGENQINGCNLTCSMVYTHKQKCMHAHTFCDHPSNTTFSVLNWLVANISNIMNSLVHSSLRTNRYAPGWPGQTRLVLFIYLRVCRNVTWHIYGSKTWHVVSSGFTTLNHVHFIRVESQLLEWVMFGHVAGSLVQDKFVLNIFNLYWISKRMTLILSMFNFNVWCDVKI